MPTLQIRNLPPEIYDKLKSSAKKNHRSLNQEAIALLERILNHESSDERERRKLKAIERIQVHKLPDINMDQVVKWIRDDRDSK